MYTTADGGIISVGDGNVLLDGEGNVLTDQVLLLDLLLTLLIPRMVTS